ncbi:MAG: hypothetical protein L6R40_005005 [Gallowayella cf. fulva]|nr:MAG: hypothetical protein L6R40_005005 [Xanthomendoza cf. fulva]
MLYKGKEKPTVQITLTDGQQDAFIPSYTTLEEIKGYITVIPQVDTKIDQVYITFEGFVKTYVERVGTASATNGRTEGFRELFRLVQPIQVGALPEGKVEALKPLTFPFEFAVPAQLLPQYCTHPVEKSAVHGAHVQLPPTLGDPLTAGWGKSMMDDMAPEMSVVAYSVRARLASGRDEKSRKWIWIAEESRKVRVIPAVPEHPPLAVLDGKQDDYRLRKEKPIKKGTFQKKIGDLVMEAAQPPSLHLPPPRTENPCPITTMATVNLRFDPASPEDQPPRLKSLVTKLKIGTFFASKPVRDIPNRSSDFHYHSDRGLYVETLTLSSRCMASVGWVKYGPYHTLPQYPSALSNSNSANPTPSEHYKAGHQYYIAQIAAPVTLPQKSEGSTTNKIFVPTFHTCLLSRVYVLDLILTCHTPGASVTVPEMHLKLPIQISADPNPEARPKISEGEAQAIARRETAESFYPLDAAPPTPAYTEQAQGAGVAPPSPGYDEAPPTRESRRPSSDYPGPIGARDGNGRFESPPDLPPPDYMIQTSGRPNVSR